MQYRKLGPSDLDVSAIGLGTMTWGLQNNQEQGFEQMDYALEQGINFFDTAEMYAIPPSEQTYGTTETIIGNWFASRATREKIILATKITGPGLAWIRDGGIINRKNLMSALEDSLKRLRTDYIDLYQLHWPNRGSYHFGKTWNYTPRFDVLAEEENFFEVLQTVQDLKESGKIRYFGLSNETAWGLLKYLELSKKHDLPRVISMQNEYSLLCRHFESDLSEIAVNEQCGLLAWSPLCRGLLSGKYLGGARPQGSRLTIETRKEHRIGPQTDAAVQAYVDLAHRFELDPSQMALSFVVNQPFVSSMLIGATNMTQLKTDIGAFSLTLPEELLQEIETTRRQFPAPF